VVSAIEAYTPRIALVNAPKMRSTQFIRVEMPCDLEELVPDYLAARRAELPELVKLAGQFLL
jgi:hypothetical protein